MSTKSLRSDTAYCPIHRRIEGIAEFNPVYGEMLHYHVTLRCGTKTNIVSLLCKVAPEVRLEAEGGGDWWAVKKSVTSVLEKSDVGQFDFEAG